MSADALCDVYHKWLYERFEPASRPPAEDLWRVLVFGGDEPHVSVEDLVWLLDRKITLFRLPWDCVGALQDTCFQSMAQTVPRASLSSDLYPSQPQPCPVDSHTHYEACHGAAPAAKVVQAWEDSGLVPFDRMVLEWLLRDPHSWLKKFCGRGGHLVGMGMYLAPVHP